MAMQDLGIELDEEDPELEFEGFWLPEQMTIDTWFAYRNYGVLPFAGGLLDQPSPWWRDIRMCEAIYNYAYKNHKDNQQRADDEGLFK